MNQIPNWGLEEEKKLLQGIFKSYTENRAPSVQSTLCYRGRVEHLYDSSK